MALTYESLPPQIQQMLMQRFGVRTPADAQQLMQRLANNPQELAQVLQELGIDASPEDAAQLTAQAQDWIDNAATQAVEDGETPPKPPEEGDEEAPPAEAPPEEEQAQPEPEQGDEAPSQDYDDEDATQPDDDEAEEGEGSPPQAASDGASGSDDMPATRASAKTGATVQDMLSAATGGRSVPSIRGGVAKRQQQEADIDAAITDMLSKGRQEGGAPTQARNFQAPRPKMPHSSAATASQDPRMRKMIADIYRTTANQSSGAERKYAPSGDRA